MEIRTVAPGLAVGAQVFPADVALLARAGFRAVVCNRPDGETAGQPDFAQVEEAARAHGLAAHYLPAESGKVSDEQARRFAELLEELPQPVLAYCRSGMRSCTLWALARAQAGDPPVPAIVHAAAAAGFNLEGLAPRLAAQGGPEATTR